jgi:L-alanine-DL-glutamate epimerase-like enolase superfamily enzyme
VSGGSRIVDARLRVLRARSGDGIAMSFAPLTHRAMVLVEVETADGRVGYGESWINYPPWAASERTATLREGVFPLLLGEDADRIRQLHATLRSRLGPLGRQWGAPGPIMQAISAVDVALWDLAGKAGGVAVSRLAGGRYREEIPVYASSLGPDGVPEQAARCAAFDHTAVKVKLGFGRERDERILAEARTALGDGTTLYADANQGWTLAEAIAMAPLLRSYGVQWIEEPVRGDRVADLEALHSATGVLIATGENVYGCEEFTAYAASPAVAILQPDIAKTGGMTECLTVCELAHAYGKSVLPHLYGGAVAFAATLQLAATAPAVAGVEYDIRDNPLRDPLLTDPPSVRHGRIALPDLPGIGARLDGEAVAEHTVPAAAPAPSHEKSPDPAAGEGATR